MSERVQVAAKKPEVKRENQASHTTNADQFQSMSPPIEHVLFLQQTIGNQAVQRLVKSGILQAKLRIEQPGNKYEQEADRVVDEVMRMPELEMQRQVDEEEEEEELIQTKSLAEEITSLVQRQVEEEEEELQAKEIPGQISEVIPNLEARINAVRGSGQPLPKATRAFFEPRFGYEFSQVRVHNDAKADALNRSLNARAFTTGQDVFFAMGKYTPGSSSGRELLAHELTHVIQQNGDQVQGAVQRIIELPEIEITGDPHFYLRAQRRNQHWSNNPPQPGWPYDDELHQLWGDGSYDEFAERIGEYQVEVMGIPLDDIDGILGPNTAASLAAGGEAAGSGFPAPPAGVLELATGSPWRFHEPVYNRFQSAGRDLGIPGLAPTWQGYLRQMGVTTFLGRRVAGHQAFLAKLGQAEAWLRREHPGLSNAQLLTTVGTVGGRTQWRAGESTTSYHVFGLALDIDPGQNPWIASSGGSRQEWTIWRAVWLMGGGARAVWSAQSHAWASEEGMTTQALHDRFRQSSQAVADYFNLRDDQDALRDEAGLSWGAADLGARKSGDFMHFDMRNPHFEVLRNAIRSEMATAMSPYESQLAERLPDAIDQEIETLGISQPQQRQFRNVMSGFYNQSLSRYFGRWTDEQRANLMGTLGEMWQNSNQRTRFAPWE